MKLYYLKEDALETLRTNIRHNAKNYSKPTNDWIYKFFQDEDPFDEFKLEVNDFKLDTSKEDPASTDLENIKILYSNLKMLTDSQAVDERFWVGLAHSTFWGYMNQRWELSNKKLEEKDIKLRFFFSHGQKRSLIVHSLSKLWWTGRITYDENRSNPFELTEFFRSNYYHKNLVMFSFSFSNNRMITRAFLRAMLDIEKSGSKISTKVFDETIKYLNVLSGTYLLDYLEEDELKRKIEVRAKELIIGNN